MLLQFQCLISIYISTVFGHRDAAYSSSADDGFKLYNDWMKRIPDNTLLSELALPGTHDSSTFISAAPVTKTQALTFSEQLNYGIRFLDIRILHEKDKFILCHGVVTMCLFFNVFLDAVTKFLHKNPSETVLFRLKEDQWPDQITRNIGHTLKEYLDLYKSTYLHVTNPQVSLGEARGKFLIISDNHEFHGYGIAYDHFDKQDQYFFKTQWGLYSKWEAIREHLDKARNGNNQTFYINYLSATGGSFPYFFASGHITSGTSAARLTTGLIAPLAKNKYPDFPRVCHSFGVCTIVFEGTNILTRDYLKNHPQRKRSCGVIMADFPGTDLISTIINENF